MTRRGFYECDICKTASTDETLFRGVVIDPDSEEKRILTEAFAHDRHVCLECIRFLTEYKLRQDVDKRQI